MQLNDHILQLIKLPGNIADVGVWQGHHSKDLADNKGLYTNLHLFDTFSGLPIFGNNDTPWDTGGGIASKMGDYACSLPEVKAIMIVYKNILYYQGLIQETATLIDQLLFNYVAIDLDLYDGTIFSLNFFYPRLIYGGLIQVHDYHTIKGIKIAVDEFIQQNTLSLINFVDSAILINKNLKPWPL